MGSRDFSVQGDAFVKRFSAATRYKNESKFLGLCGKYDVPCVVELLWCDELSRSLATQKYPYQLEELICSGGIRIEDRHYIAEQLQAFLHTLHARGIVHNDFKAKNVLVAADRRTVRVADFELAKFSSERSSDLKKYRFLMVQLFSSIDYKSSYMQYDDYVDNVPPELLEFG